MSGFLINPFKEERLSKVNSRHFVFPTMIENACAKVFVIGEEQYAQFVWNRFVLGKEDIIATTITRNNFKLPKDIKVLKLCKPNLLR